MRFSHASAWLTAATSLFAPTLAIEITVSDPKSVEKAASIAGAQMLTYYNGTKYGYAPGILTNPYYWWEAGAMFGIMIHFWHLTGNDSLNQLVMDGLLWQKGDQNNFEPANQTKDLGNDDQSFWAYAALDAAEFGFPNPPEGNPSWLALAQAVFNRQIARWDSANCGGGLRWQIYQFNPGYNYKNTAANGGLFHIAARLARYTGNSTYADQANRLWDWMVSVNFVNGTDRPSTYAVIDGADIGDNCTDEVDQIQWTYNHGTVLMGAAYMYNYTNGSSLWKDRLGKLVNGSDVFFVSQQNNVTDSNTPAEGKILCEVACETQIPQTCKVDQPAFKSMLIRWIAMVTVLAPQHAAHIYPLLNATAQGAAQQCVGSFGTTATTNPTAGGPKGNWCGRRWYQSTFDGLSGLGEQMSAMSAFQNVLIQNSSAPYTTVTGGNSTSDPDAGNAPTNPTLYAYIYTQDVTRGDTAGAWILTALGFIIIGVGTIWMVREDDDWAGSTEQAGWMAPSAGAATYYRKTYGYGAYRLAGLQAGGVYKGKTSHAHRAFAKNVMPSIGLGAGGWWFGTGRGTGEKWWEKNRAQHEEEQAARAGPYGHFPRDSMAPTEASVNSSSGLFGRGKKAKKDDESKKSKLNPKGLGPEWKEITKGVYVRQREVGGEDASNAEGSNEKSARQSSQTITAPSRAATRTPSRTDTRRTQGQQVADSRNASRAQSRRESLAKAKTLHWPAND